MALFAPRATTVLLALVALWALADGRLRRAALAAVPRPLLALLGAFASWALVSLTWTPSPAEAAWLWLRMVMLGVAGVLVVGASARAARALDGALALGLCVFVVVIGEEMASGGMLLGALIGLWNLATPWQASAPTSGNLLAPSAAALAVYAWPAAVATGRRFGRAAMVLAIIATLFVLYLQPMLAAFVAGLAAALVFGLALRSPRLAGSAVLVGLLAMNLAAMIAAGLGLAADEGLPVSWRERLHIIDFAMAKIAEAPVLGWGFDAARHLGQDVIGPFAGNRLIPLHPHNGWLQIWLELGLPGLALAVALLGWLVLFAGPGQASGPARAAGIAAATAFSVVAGISFGIWQSWWLAVAWSGAAFSVAVSKGKGGRDPDDRRDTESV